MTDNEIINDFEKEIKYVRENEKYDDFNPIVDIDLCEDILDLINRQKAEIERLNIECQSMRNAANSYKMHYETAKSEAIKEFAERLKEKLNNLEYHENSDRKTVTKAKLYHVVNWIMHEVVPDEIDNLVKEMTEENEYE